MCKKKSAEALLLILLKVSIAALIFAIGTNTTAQDVTYLWQRPMLLVKSLVAMYVVMPVAAAMMAWTLDLPPQTELALVVLAICAGAPLLPKKLIRFGGDPAYVFSLIVTTSLLAIVTVPVSVHLLSGSIDLPTTTISPGQVAGIILKSFLIPLGSGMLVRGLLPSVAGLIGDPLMKIAGMAMALSALAILAFGFRFVFMVGPPSLLAFAIFTLTAIATGHLLGGPNAADRSALAIACASRHIGLALLIAANSPGQVALALVAAYLLSSAAVSVIYAWWIKRGHIASIPSA